MSEDSQSQTLRAILGLRGLVVDGELKSGARVSEAVIVERLGVSRTPARMALVKMHDEGLLEYVNGGYVVASFSEADLYDAIQIRGSLEGMAARFAAERGISATTLAAFDRCLNELDEIVARTDDGSFYDYSKLNDRFHELLIQASGSRMLERSLAQIVKLPFAAPNAFVHSAHSIDPKVRELMRISQRQHRIIVEQIKERKGTRAEALVIEHSFSATNYLQLVIEGKVSLDTIPALSLVQPLASMSSPLKH
jgi:GntR family transcriptional regulator of vanillate catabolism